MTDELPDSQSQADTAVESAAAETEAAQSDREVSEPESTSEGAPEGELDETEARFRVRRPVGKWTTIAAAVAAVLFVGSAGFAGAAVQPYLSDRATAATKLQIARTAANAITTLWTYKPDNMDKLADRAAQYLSGDFEAQYRKYIDGIVAANKQAQITNATEVTGAAVESLDGNDATAIVYTNTTSTSPLSKNIPALKYLSYRLNLRRDHAHWLVTKMTTITSVSLTPQV